MTCHNSEPLQITQVAPGVDLLGAPPLADCYLRGFTSGGCSGRERRVFWLVHLSIHLSLSRYQCDWSSGECKCLGAIFLLCNYFLSQFKFCCGSRQEREQLSARHGVPSPSLQFFSARPTGSTTVKRTLWL